MKRFIVMNLDEDTTDTEAQKLVRWFDEISEPNMIPVVMKIPPEIEESFDLHYSAACLGIDL